MSASLNSVPVEVCEDETSIVKQIVYHEESDILSGFCGLKDSDVPHTYVENPSVSVGDDKGYDNIIEAFQNSLIATKRSRYSTESSL